MHCDLSDEIGVFLRKPSFLSKFWKGNHSCSAGYRCINTPGAYRCEEIDECQDENVCGQNSNCINTDGSYYCTCRAGYEGFVLFILDYNTYRIIDGLSNNLFRQIVY